VIKPVPEVAALTLYSTGALAPTVDLRLDVTERPLPLAEVGEAGMYPKPALLEAALAERFGVPRERVLVTAGADEAIDRVCRAYLSRERSALVTLPTFEMIPHYAKLAGARVEETQWFHAELAVPDIAVDVRFIVSPNNPTGYTVPTTQLTAIAERYPESLLLVDMAYGEFASEDPTAALLRYPNVVMTRTFSKAWGLPGARVGYALSSPEVIAALRVAGGPYSVARPSIALALDRLKVGEAEMRAYVARARDEVETLKERLEARGIGFYPHTEANFVLLHGENVPAFADALAKRGISMRAFRDPRMKTIRRLCTPCDATVFTRLLRAIDEAAAEAA
jgi:histidinol-phosphate aminotransferase